MTKKWLLGILLLAVAGLYWWLNDQIACDEVFSQELSEQVSGRFPERKIARVIISSRRAGTEEWDEIGEIGDQAQAREFIRKVRTAIFEPDRPRSNTAALGSTLLALRSPKTFRLKIYNLNKRFTFITISPWDTKDGRNVYLIWIGCDHPFSFVEERTDLVELARPYIDLIKDKRPS